MLRVMYTTLLRLVLPVALLATLLVVALLPWTAG